MSHATPTLEEVLTPMRLRKRFRRRMSECPSVSSSFLSPLVADAYEQGRRSALWEASRKSQLDSLEQDWHGIKSTPKKRMRFNEEPTFSSEEEGKVNRRRSAILDRERAGVSRGFKSEEPKARPSKNVHGYDSNANADALKPLVFTAGIGSTCSGRSNTPASLLKRASRVPTGKGNRPCSNSKECGRGKRATSSSKSFAERRKAAEEKFLARQKAAKRCQGQSKR